MEERSSDDDAVGDWIEGLSRTRSASRRQKTASQNFGLLRQLQPGGGAHWGGLPDSQNSGADPPKLAFRGPSHCSGGRTWAGR